ERLGFSAERAGLDEIDLAINWLATRLQYSLALVPDGATQPFERERHRVRLSRGELVAVRGLATQRRWLRSAALDTRTNRVSVNPNDPLLSKLSKRLTAADRLALAACHRAISGSEPLER